MESNFDPDYVQVSNFLKIKGEPLQKGASFLFFFR